MLSTSTHENTVNTSTTTVSNSSVPCWPLLEPALNQLFPQNLPSSSTATSALSSDDYLKMYTIVFEHCVGPVEGRKASTVGAGLNVSGEELYFTLVKYLQVRLSQWAHHLENSATTGMLDSLLSQLDKLQAAEKPLTFIFTYLERHWIDRQINESRVDVLPMKQLIWSMWDALVLNQFFTGAVLPEIGDLLQGVRRGQVELEALNSVARFVHYLRVISKPTQLESNFKATKRAMMAGAVINPHAQHHDRFKEFVQFFCEGIERDCPKMTNGPVVTEFVQASLQFWNEEEGRMAYLRFDKSSQVTVRNHLKSRLLLPHLQAIKHSFKDAICNWNVLEANAIYRLLANRKSLLVHLDSESEVAFIQKGNEMLSTADTGDEDMELLFINLIGQFYTKLDELIQTSFASRPEIYESRSKAFRVILNNPPILKNNNKSKGFAARSLAKFADFVIRNFPDSTEENLQVLVALFRLIDEKEEFLETYSKLLALRLLTRSTLLPSAFESNLLSELKQICGAYSVKSFEKMFADVQQATKDETILTAGNWNIKGKLLPGHVLFAETSVWPCENITLDVTEKSRSYHQKNPKRKLLWSPLLSTVEFSFSIGNNQVYIKGSCMHLSALQMLSAGDLDGVEALAPFGGIMLNSLVASGLVLKGSDGSLAVNWKYSGAGEIDLYSILMTELLTSSFVTTIQTGTPPHYFSAGNPRNSVISNNHNTNISYLDKSILLQCAVTRILKQLRLQPLPDLFNRLSMLPSLLTRFSPSIGDVLEACKGLHEKEFVRMAVGEGVDDLVDLCDNLGDLERMNTNNLFIKYLA